MNFHFSKKFIFGAFDKFFKNATIGPPNSLRNTEVEPSALRTFDYLNSKFYKYVIAAEIFDPVILLSPRKEIDIKI